MRALVKIWVDARRCGERLARDRSGLAATEFAFIVPLMLLMFFATVEISTWVAVDRKVTLVSRTLSDLVSQATSVTDKDLPNVFLASYGVLAPYPTDTAEATISEIYVNQAGVAKVQWSKTATVAQSGGNPTAKFAAPKRKPGDTLTTLPDGLKVKDTYLILSEVNYQYTPAVGYFLAKTGVKLADESYTRPRQSLCVLYDTQICPTL
ncbi:TadE/TadG family type IV pilus assembly protein [Rhodopseudomonas pseudopalustris]|uniref:TadE-like protein n=1 Tax=Rhodopseudomonas pseudopalustris TaxID=1513892 RepID=A0A1H8QPR9_9BRAD|nr:TadE/TadG family type IV pilus assembly protein [Rhodopseudomonas pseudopalustris]SEO56046.1 TadE-like protein [Rhodopseudomonas pseudopalustris]